MKPSTTHKFCAFALVLVPLLGGAQSAPRTNTYSIQSWWSSTKPVIYPQVTPDRHITFQVKAPQASRVNLNFGEWNIQPKPMSRNEQGIWSITIGPVEPDLYQYTFQIDGQRVIDLGNPAVKVGLAVDASLVDVPGTPPRFDQVQDVPHGALHSLQYHSKALNRLRGLCVYVPPGYQPAAKRRYPVLYLRHGGGDNEQNWSRDGRAGVILDNLQAQRQAVPMLIVMTDGTVDGTWSGSSSPEGMKLLEADLLGDVIPFIEQNYRVEAKPASRAIAGLSMGGGQAFVIGLNHPDTFAWVGEFSSGLLSDVNFKLDQQVPGAREVSSLNQRLRLLWLACGTSDPRYNGHLNLADQLQARGIRHEFHDTPGGHEWKVWRVQLCDFAKKLFKP
jgi:enterochelin esterase-like enzyme